MLSECYQFDKHRPQFLHICSSKFPEYCLCVTCKIKLMILVLVLYYDGLIPSNILKYLLKGDVLEDHYYLESEGAESTPQAERAQTLSQ